MGYTESLVWCEVAYLVITNYPLQLPLTQGEKPLGNQLFPCVRERNRLIISSPPV